MTTFYLQQHVEGGRWLIDSTFPLSAHRVEKSCEAAEWLEAKKKFDFPLSPVQAALLDKHHEERAQLAEAA